MIVYSCSHILVYDIVSSYPVFAVYDIVSCCLVPAIVDSSRRLQLMQWSVIRGWMILLERLLQRGHAADVDHDCNGPLHLACKLGDALAVKLLIQHGANVNARSTACYPTSSLHLVNDSPYGPSTYCYVHLKSSPLQIALAHDSVQVVKLILEHPACRHQIDQTLVLHQACQCDAKACVEYLAERVPSAINVRDPRSGETPLYIALMASEQCARIMLQGAVTIEAGILTNCSGKGDCALHTLYVSAACPSLLAMTLMLQERAVDLVNCRDRADNTPLHLLCARAGPLVAQRHDNEDHQSDIYLCVKYLLNRCKDVTAVNRKGETFVHALLGNWLHNLNLGKFVVSMGEPNRILQLLLSHGVDPNAASDEVCTVTNKLVNCTCSLDACTVSVVAPELLKSVVCLCEHKADLNMPDEKGIYMVTRLLTACNRWLNHCTEDDSCTLAILSGVRNILETLFTHGMRPPEDILRLSVKQLAIISNINFQGDNFGQDLKLMLSLILCSGLNPNLMKAVCDGRATDTNKADDIQYFVARGFVIHRQHEGMLRFFSIFEDTLTQPKLNWFIWMLTEILASDFQETVLKRTADSVSALERCSRRPRSLLVLSRIAVNNAIYWDVLNKKRELPLPGKMQDYLGQFN